MKRTVTLVLVMLLMLTFFSSCDGSYLILTSSEDIAEERMSSLLNALESGEKSEVKRMFAKNAVRKAENFEKQLDNLFDYFKGDVQHWEISGGVSDEEAFGFGRMVREIEGQCSVSTETGEYTICFRECVSDNFVWSNIGLVSLRVYPTEDEKLYNEAYDPSYKPYGLPGVPPDDIMDIPGIFIPQAPEVVIENEEDTTFKRVVDSLGVWNKNGVRNVFAYSVMAEYECYEEQLTALFDYYEGNYQSFERREYSENEHLLHGNVVILETRAVYEVKTDKQDYLFIFYSTPKYNADPKMRGIQSLRVIRAEDEEQYFPDWSVMDETQGIFVPKE